LGNAQNHRPYVDSDGEKKVNDLSYNSCSIFSRDYNDVGNVRDIEGGGSRDGGLYKARAK
jgi:hypothetical protein